MRHQKQSLNCQKRVLKSHLRIIGPRSSIYMSQNMGNKRRRGLVFAHCSEALVPLMTCESRVLDLARFWQASTSWRRASKPSTANALTTRALALTLVVVHELALLGSFLSGPSVFDRMGSRHSTTSLKHKVWWHKPAHETCMN